MSHAEIIFQGEHEVTDIVSHRLLARILFIVHFRCGDEVSFSMDFKDCDEDNLIELNKLVGTYVQVWLRTTLEESGRYSLFKYNFVKLDNNPKF